MVASFEGKVIAITGGSSGMGLSISKLPAAQGTSFSLLGVQEEALNRAISEIQAVAAPDVRVIGTKADVRERSQVEAWVKKTVMELGKVNGAVNFAGVINKTMGKPEGETEVLDHDEWDFCIGINLTGVMQCCGLRYRSLQMMAVPLLMQQAR